ncbi:MAG: TIGR00153 family protein [Deltaproteobacteria bacterium]|nr:TIGR00153 family protein [Deltaproteobacteria bacterium]MBW1949178.1 TIGR00153 family protein [Deltaproteobacteria bacterium]MBW2007071.1 TIGR00153 family protein [Deltaproteobacteria bacterium]MBW2347751.1 TIGR00153 family protein [Deltaproteobacteria bacterium]RLB39278.1 MAG: TIGR00153 family protein [Deltaproteobacteria bacterium]
MRLLLSSLFHTSPFENLQKHADMVRDCAKLFREAALMRTGEEPAKFEEITDKVAHLESRADAVKRNIRNHLPRGVLMPVDKFQFLQYVREQDKVLDEVEEALLWLSLRSEPIPEAVAADFKDLVEAVIPPIEKLSDLVAMATDFFKSRTEGQRTRMKSLIQDIRQHENEADFLEHELKVKIFQEIDDALAVFHLVRLVEIVGHIADHAENASDRMRAMIAR